MSTFELSAPAWPKVKTVPGTGTFVTPVWWGYIQKGTVFDFTVDEVDDFAVAVSVPPSHTVTGVNSVTFELSITGYVVALTTATHPGGTWSTDGYPSIPSAPVNGDPFGDFIGLSSYSPIVGTPLTGSVTLTFTPSDPAVVFTGSYLSEFVGMAFLGVNSTITGAAGASVTFTSVEIDYDTDIDPDQLLWSPIGSGTELDFDSDAAVNWTSTALAALGDIESIRSAVIEVELTDVTPSGFGLVTAENVAGSGEFAAWEFFGTVESFVSGPNPSLAGVTVGTTSAFTSFDFDTSDSPQEFHWLAYEPTNTPSGRTIGFATEAAVPGDATAARVTRLDVWYTLTPDVPLPTTAGWAYGGSHR